MDFIHVRNHCAILVRDDKRRFQETLTAKFTENQELLYQHDNRHRKVKHIIPPLKSSSGLTGTPTEAANALLKQYSTVFLVHDESDDIPRISVTPRLASIQFTPELAKAKRLAIKANGAPGFDNIHSKVLVLVADELSEPLAKYFEELFDHGAIPDMWEKV